MRRCAGSLEDIAAPAARPNIEAQAMRDAYAANGFEFPEDSAMGFFADMRYLSAVKR